MNFHGGENTIIRPLYPHNGYSCAGETTSLYQIKACFSYTLFIFLIIQSLLKCRNICHWHALGAKANLSYLIAATGIVILLKLHSNHQFFSPCDLKFDGWPKKNMECFLYYFKLCESLCDLDIWQMTLKNKRAPLLYYIKLWVSFQSHGWIQTGVKVRKRSIQVNIGDFLSRVTLKFDRWTWKTIGHLCYAISSFVHHFLAIGELKLQLQLQND